jgi:hypothetical protein
VVLIYPFYETIDSVRQIIYKSSLNVSKYEKALVIINSLKGYFSQQPDKNLKSLVNFAEQIRRNCLSIMGDIESP